MKGERNRREREGEKMVKREKRKSKGKRRKYNLVVNCSNFVNLICKLFLPSFIYTKCQNIHKKCISCNLSQNTCT